MLYSFDINNSCKYGYLTYTLDYYDIKDTKCETCGRTKQNIYLKYWPPKMTLEGGKKYPDFLNIVTPFVDRCGIVISERAFKAFQLEKISGFFAEPITVFDNPKNVKVALTMAKIEKAILMVFSVIPRARPTEKLSMLTVKAKRRIEKKLVIVPFLSSFLERNISKAKIKKTIATKKLDFVTNSSKKWFPTTDPNQGIK